jgi:Tol biopolymer transport system component
MAGSDGPFRARTVYSAPSSIANLPYAYERSLPLCPVPRFTRPHNLGAPVNSTLDEGALAFTAASRTMYFTACLRRDGQGDCDIYEWDGGASTPRPVAALNSPYWDTQPTLSRDGSTIIFVSNRQRGLGRWGAPINLGPTINTPADERFVTVQPDGSHIYFASSRRDLPNAGRLDIFVARFIK